MKAPTKHSPTSSTYIGHRIMREARVGILITGTGLWELAYDTKTGKEIPFTAIRAALAHSIAVAYHLKEEKDPIEWAGSPEAHEEFFRLHPEIHVSYGPNP